MDAVPVTLLTMFKLLSVGVRTTPPTCSGRPFLMQKRRTGLSGCADKIGHKTPSKFCKGSAEETQIDRFHPCQCGCERGNGKDIYD